MQPKELTICGLAAVRAQFATDAAAIKRLFFDLPTSRRLGVISRAMAQARKVYRCVPDEELAKIAGTIHHGGVVAVVAAPPLRAPAPNEPVGWAQRVEPLVVLDRIGNAHNLGAIARTAAFFGVPRLVLAGEATGARPGEAAHRVAEGGLAHLEVLSVPDLAGFLRQLRAAGYEVVGAATRGGRPRAPGRTTAPLALVLGNEEHGLAADVAAACSRLVTLPGSGKVESLNVSVAAGILLWELHARR
jgi:TrmH RNA methyltransferase